MKIVDLLLEEYEGLRPPGNIWGVNIFPFEESVVGKKIYHTTTAANFVRIFNSGGMKPRPDRSGARELGRGSTNEYPFHPTIGIYFADHPDSWSIIGPITFEVTIQEEDKVARSYSPKGWTLIMNPIPWSRLTVVRGNKIIKSLLAKNKITLARRGTKNDKLKVINKILGKYDLKLAGKSPKTNRVELTVLVGDWDGDNPYTDHNYSNPNWIKHKIHTYANLRKLWAKYPDSFSPHFYDDARFSSEAKSKDLALSVEPEWYFKAFDLSQTLDFLPKVVSAEDRAQIQSIIGT